MPELDQYNQDGIDDAEQAAMRYEDRLEAERAMAQRDKMQQKGHLRMADAFVSDGDGEFSGNDEYRRQMRFNQRQNYDMAD